MKFCKNYEEYMEGQMQKELPGVGFKKLKKILKSCSRDMDSHARFHDQNSNSSSPPPCSSTCPNQCPVCNGTFFPSLVNEMSTVVWCFNERDQKLLDWHLATTFNKCFIWFKGRVHGNQGALVQEGKDLVTYAMINAIAMRKIFKKSDKIHYSKQGQAFKTQARSMRIEILQSPWLSELMAFHINMRELKGGKSYEETGFPF